MKHLLLLLALSAPATALAQHAGGLQQDSVLLESSNPHGFILAHDAVLYENLSDTLSKLLIVPLYRRLQSGDDVVVWRDHPRWLQVVRGNGEGTGFSTSTMVYYLSVQALKDARRFILL